MQKLELLNRIQKLASIVHSEDLTQQLSAESLNDLRRVLDEMTEEYIVSYC
ncbi:Hypothetical protein LUCI_3964 [Lucifera butyrica]|uniref:Uncharacterized protein n=1 Tax=Lucifera butyrica TaxID=1351585 RepID=A0A498R7F3_9FIRM|nr:hypothetical protein [Lucifera butyrica]VBB08686.1 Hypothetical protein LUCI_3964 [Lucifera butyrica]